ncbi:isoleucine--tRNA ligase [candidate division WOR-1 bacterium RIFOXYC2_FULL_37_10]|uniref:Isoleucine--tRNA ligase n=1 Tax=candidate division WOR-1 bacterium RIFOXYB2_FULL_37_13 TaxID=1802579 RepID=A0A1F4SXG9_UNCSA|nr:MAG: isoleucine--tRNA ligase [candidate division WOR-1 bacterium RIFOXYA2_FULL_37_7]OGC25136.1 MAG: isoleucine--tRNA ligase [candidate division WOR-1 bacterium RIFOXYB2_FULL_37_13]OGC36311.1 MAG: isoleucine--tRNA ligase [candidate division WOR-1 bacterium RIFOXYC2_FULL_37_10]
MEYKQTLNLPKTDLPIRANSAAVEEEFLKFWADNNIYKKLLEKNKDKDKFILHDGPPYANGHIHLGHAINRILKDIVVKYKSMSGFNSPFIPGWDCHGLPIETQLQKELGDKKHDVGILEFRKKCHDYAMNFVDIQREESINLGLLGDWFNPYLTLDPLYEEKIIETFGKLADEGYIYRGLKPIHWCPNCETALAEAEIEYEDEKSPSIYVKFKVKDQKSAAASHFSPIANMNASIFFIIWTTTPWTLPANVAIAAHPEYEYAFVSVKDEIWIIAEELVNTVMHKFGVSDYKIIDKTKGKNLEGIATAHPFIERDSVLVLDEYVTLEQGTGLVHIAPGHGMEDYKVGLNYKLPIIMPVDSSGNFDNSVPDFIKGKNIIEANKIIGQKLENDGNLLKLEFIKHSYPHCWRCKKPVIFRATEQWFISVEHKNMREKALKAVADTNWIPSWGENRIRGMIDTRPDWCISRQRSWGVPIPAFYCAKCKKVHFGGEFNKATEALIRKEGTDGWFKYEPKDFLPKDLRCECGSSEFKKETDILDVWFESGSSHAAVLETRLSWPADLYLEGSDQHRGWFQSSLLTSVGTKGRAPFNAVLTHGFTIDDKGKKMSKSLGNVIDPLEVIKKYGADVLRLWVASTDFRNDMAASDKILKQVQDAYLKIRNTCRFLLSNLSDFEKSLDLKDLEELDKWILIKLNELIKKVNAAYEKYEPHIVYHSIYDFCVTDLSAHYLDMSKDRLYCDKKGSNNRSSAQTAINEILLTLLKLMAPILSFTAEDIYRYYNQFPMSNVQCPMFKSIFLTDLPRGKKELENLAPKEEWEKLFEIREKVYKIVEEARKEKKIASSVAAMVSISAKDKELALLKAYEKTLEVFFIVSKIELTEGDFNVVVSSAPGQKCERCWQVKESVGQNNEHATLCERCQNAIS